MKFPTSFAEHRVRSHDKLIASDDIHVASALQHQALPVKSLNSFIVRLPKWFWILINFGLRKVGIRTKSVKINGYGFPMFQWLIKLFKPTKTGEKVFHRKSVLSLLKQFQLFQLDLTQTT